MLLVVGYGRVARPETCHQFEIAGPRFPRSGWAIILCAAPAAPSEVWLLPMDLLVDAAMLETMSISDATDLGASCGVLGGSAGGSDVQ